MLATFVVVVIFSIALAYLLSSLFTAAPAMLDENSNAAGKALVERMSRENMRNC